MPAAQSLLEKILVVDDTAMTRRLLETHLVSAGYHVTLAEDGEEALVRFQQDRPHLVLLDVQMPQLDGFETCRRLRVLPEGKEVAVVFLTGLTDLRTHDEAMRSGGDDFLTKPVNKVELLMRVRSLLWMNHLRGELRQGYDMIRSQRDQLLRTERQKQDLTEFVVHDLKNPLTGVIGFGELLAMQTETLSESMREAVHGIVDAGRTMERMLLNLLDISRGEEGSLTPEIQEIDLVALVESVRRLHVRRAEELGISIDTAVDATGRLVRADPDLLRRLIENFVDNALKYSPRGSAVRVEVARSSEAIEVRVRDQGPGIPPEHRESVFDKFTRLESGGAWKRVSRGLGLTFCRLAAEAHGGAAWVEANQPVGSVFCALLPTS